MLWDVLGEIASAVGNKTQTSFRTLQEGISKVSVDSAKPELKHRKVTSQNGKPNNLPHEHTLEEKKKLLLKELTSIEGQLRKRHVEKSRVTKKTENSLDDIQAFDKANQLISRMNKQRRQKTEAHRKWSEGVQMKVQKSLKKFAEMNELQEKEKEERRLQIEQRIQDRKRKLLVRKQYNKKADNLISELQSYRVSLPAINLCSNPEEGHGISKPEASLRRYPKSPFYDRVQQEDLSRKREQYLKDYEKKKIRERQQMYGRKIRKNLKDSSVFVTD